MGKHWMLGCQGGCVNSLQSRRGQDLKTMAIVQNISVKECVLLPSNFPIIYSTVMKEY